MGVLADKDFVEEASIIGNKATKIYTITPNNSRGLDSNRLADIMRENNSNVVASKTIDEAVRRAVAEVKNDESDMIIAFGSLSILKDIKEALNKILNS